MNEALDDCTSWLNEAKNVDGDYFYFGKAFDRVNQRKLLSRIDVRPLIIPRLRDFLHARSFQDGVIKSFSKSL